MDLNINSNIQIFENENYNTIQNNKGPFYKNEKTSNLFINLINKGLKYSNNNLTNRSFNNVIINKVNNIFNKEKDICLLNDENIKNQQLIKVSIDLYNFDINKYKDVTILTMGSTSQTIYLFKNGVNRIENNPLSSYLRNVCPLNSAYILRSYRTDEDGLYVLQLLDKQGLSCTDFTDIENKIKEITKDTIIKSSIELNENVLSFLSFRHKSYGYDLILYGYDLISKDLTYYYSFEHHSDSSLNPIYLKSSKTDEFFVFQNFDTLQIFDYATGKNTCITSSTLKSFIHDQFNDAELTQTDNIYSKSKLLYESFEECLLNKELWEISTHSIDKEILVFLILTDSIKKWFLVYNMRMNKLKLIIPSPDNCTYFHFFNTSSILYIKKSKLTLFDYSNNKKILLFNPDDLTMQDFKIISKIYIRNFQRDNNYAIINLITSVRTMNFGIRHLTLSILIDIHTQKTLLRKYLIGAFETPGIKMVKNFANETFDSLLIPIFKENKLSYYSCNLLTIKEKSLEE